MSLVQKTFVFDTNAHSYFIDNLDSIKSSKQYDKLGKEIFILFTKINFFEYLKGIKSENELIKRQKYVNEIFTAKGIIYIDPRTHIQYAAEEISMDDVKKQLGVFRNSISEFLSIQNISEFNKNFEQESKSRENRMNEIMQNGYAMQNGLHKFRKAKKNKPSEFKQLIKELHNAPNSEWYVKMSGRILKRYGLENLMHKYGRDQLFSVMPSLKYFCDVAWRYTRKFVLNKRNYDLGDYFDLDHIIYLDKVDYLITRDKNLARWVNDCGNSDLTGRAISPENFIKMMNQTEISKRAPLQLQFG